MSTADWVYNRHCRLLEEVAYQSGLPLRILARNYDEVTDTFEYYIEASGTFLERGYLPAMNILKNFVLCRW
jgi:hypothetical protein